MGKLKTQKKTKKASAKTNPLYKIKGDYLNIAAHELKTPIIPILIYLEMLKNGENITIEQKKRIEICLRNSKRLQKLIQDTIDIIKLDSNMMKFDMGLVDISNIAENSVKHLKVFAKEMNSKIILSVKEDSVIVHGDQYRLSQVMNNLVGNALKFAQNGNVRVSIEKKNGNAIVTISDNGIGIPKKEINKIFDRFYQVDNTTNHKYGGAGLGLAISKDIINYHKGRIWINSKIGRGSEFTFSIPTKVKPM